MLLYITNVNLQKISGATEHIKGFFYGLDQNNIRYVFLSLDRIKLFHKSLFLYPKIIQIIVYQLYSSFFIVKYNKYYKVLYIRYSPLVLSQIIIAKVFSKKIVLEINGDIESETVLLFNPPKIIFQLIVLFYRIALNNAYKIVVVSKGIGRKIIKNYQISHQKIIKMYNGSYIRKQNIKNDFTYKGVVLFKDNIWYNTANLLKLKSKLKNHNIDIDVYISTDYSEKYDKCFIINKTFNNYNYDWGLLLYSLDKEKKKNILYGVSPIKFFTYLSFGIPVIIPNVPDINNITRKYNVGYIYKENSVESIVSSILAIYKDKHKWTFMQKNAYSVIEQKYNWIRIVRIIINNIME